MDDVDRLALRLLARHGRMTWSDLAHHLKLSSPAAADRVRRLEERGIVRGYGALVDRTALGYGLTAFVDVDLAHASHRVAFLERIRDVPEILECHQVTGEHDYLLKLCCRSPQHLDVLLNEVVKADDLVARTRTQIVLGSPKDELFAPPEAA